MFMNIEQIISLLIHKFDCVIIPGFGGFISEYKNAYVEKDSNFIFPPNKQIAFNKNLLHNDGLLINELASLQRTSYKEAEVKVSLFVESLNDNLNLHKKVNIKGVGDLILSEDNTILFSQNESKNFLLDNYGTCKIKLSEIKRTDNKKELNPKIKTLKPSQYRNWLKAAAIIIPLITLSIIGINQQSQIEKVMANLNLIDNILIDDNYKANLTNNLDYIVYSPAINIHSVMKDVNINMKDEEKVHYIIAGAFQSKKNAYKLVKKLQKNNFKNARIIGKSKSNLYRVCYSDYSDPQEAIISLKRIKNKNSSAWLLSI